jgi:hypothetical protein
LPCHNIVVPLYYMRLNTTTLTRGQLRRVAINTLHYCVKTFGTNGDVPTISIVKRVRSKRYGQYDMVNKKIHVHHNICGDVKMIIRTIIHEYTHHMQDMSKYHDLLKTYGYKNHPQEVEAVGNEMLYTKCWKQIKHNI